MEPSGSVLDVRRSAVNSLTTSTRTLANVPLDREGLRNQWHDALNAGSIKQMTDGLKAPEESLPRGFVLANTIAALPVQSLYIFLAVLESLGRQGKCREIGPAVLRSCLQVRSLAAAIPQIGRAHV